MSCTGAEREQKGKQLEASLSAQQTHLFSANQMWNSATRTRGTCSAERKTL